MSEVKKTRKPRAKKEEPKKEEPKEEKPVEHKKVVEVVDEEHKDVPTSPPCDKKKVSEKKVKLSKKNGRPCRDSKGDYIYE
jgi:hypothetical protein